MSIPAQNLACVFFLWLVATAGVFASTTTQTQLTASDLEILHDDQEWQKLWTAVSSGMAIDINSTIPLTREQQKVALKSLAAVTTNDINSASAGEMFNEKHFIRIMHFILTEKDLYVLGYVDLAHHAMVRKPKVGAAMYEMLPFEKKAWDALPKSTIITAFFHKSEYERCIKHAIELQANPGSTKFEKDYALTLELASRYHLKQPGACDRITKVNADQLEPANNQETLRLYQRKCRDERLSPE